MYKVSDSARAKYLLRARADGKFRLLPFLALNRWRYLFFGLYILIGTVYFLYSRALLAGWFFAGLCAGMLIIEFSWFIGRNRGRGFTFATTNWEEVTRLSKSD